MDVKEETEIALKDAYWAEIRKLYESYLHSLSISQEKQAQVTAAGDRFKQGLVHARLALDQCLKLVDEVLKS
jgi:predicted proteasome-type protease